MGTILGAGLFAVPFVIEKAGVMALLVYLPALAGLQFLLHRIYAEIILSTNKRHRMPGYVGCYFGKTFRNLALVISIIGKHGALLAYIILGGVFLHGLLGDALGGNIFFYTTVLFLAEIAVVFFGLKLIAKTELALNFLLIAVVLGIVWKGFGHVDFRNFSLLEWEYFLLPYGVVFFAVGGQAAIPEVCRLLKKEKKKISSAIAWGTFLPAAIMAAFALIVVGVCGDGVTPDTLVGLKSVFQNGLIKSALAFGLLATVTSFIVICQSLREVYWWDAGMNKTLAWLLACSAPFALFALGLNNLTEVIGITGSVVGGMYGIILMAVLFRAKKNRRKKPAVNNRLSVFAAVFFAILFIAGTILEIIN